MQHEWLMAGFGGQGILFLGDILARAAMQQGLHTTYMPTYGVAMRGGTANCVVRLSDTSIGSPLLEAPDAAIILNQQSFNKFLALIQPGGLIVANSSMITQPENMAVPGNRTLWIPATIISRDTVGTEQSTNMVALGAFLAADTTIAYATIDALFDEERSPAKRKLAETNKTAIKAGMNYVRQEGIVNA